MFEMSDEELENLRSQSGTSSWGGVRYSPMAFTEQGVAMLSSVLTSPTAIKVNIQIMRLFTRMREMIASHQEVFKQLEEIRSSVKGHDDQLQMIFAYLNQLEEGKRQETEQRERRRIGFRREDN